MLEKATCVRGIPRVGRGERNPGMSPGVILIVKATDCSPSHPAAMLDQECDPSSCSA